MKTWEIRKDGIMMLNQIHETRNRDNETVRDFNERFGKLIEPISNNLKPIDVVILLQYINAFNVKFGFTLRDKFATTLEKAQEWASKIEENMSYKVEPF
jgi:hypothetical protein